jgi:NDP-4-keto-2,6-dideoxyhexose 3-C-methyltransferase
VSYTALTHCRICGNPDLERVLDLGEQMLTGVFPRRPDPTITTGPLRLVKCLGDTACGLLQLEHTYDLGEMYGDNYGYRSGLNLSMVRHLRGKVQRIFERVTLAKGDLVIDIGSNDSTTLQAYPHDLGLLLVGVDPTGTKFRDFYPEHIRLIPDFFSADLIKRELGNKRAKVVTSFSMFYDLPQPMEFMRQIHSVLADDGIWVFEQSYMPTMLKTNSYDTVCHEHLEFYGLEPIQWMCERIGFEILDVEFNDVNGGSFSVTVMKSAKPAARAQIQRLLAEERRLGLHALAPYQAFAARVQESRERLREFVGSARREGKRVAGLGASTKGNVLLQYCGFTAEDIEAIGEVNRDKFGSVTPGTWIPIVSEEPLVASHPDLLLVLPWHFRRFFESSPRLLASSLVFPLPELSIRPAQLESAPRGDRS